MGYKSGKTIQRNEISGIWEHNDVPDGEHSVSELRARSDARQEAINNSHRGDWPSDMTSSVPEPNDPTLGNAFSRMPKPVDYVVGSKADRFGGSLEDDSDSRQGGPVQKPSKAKGIEPPKKRA